MHLYPDKTGNAMKRHDLAEMRSLTAMKHFN